MNKTLLILAMPGTGKTTIVKAVNRGLFPQERIAVDFDYTAPRCSINSKNAYALRHHQTCVINIYANMGVKLITTFPDAIIFDMLDRDKIQVLWILPEDDPSYLVERCQKRSIMNGGLLTPFDTEYDKNRLLFAHQWWEIYNKNTRIDDMLIKINRSNVDQLGIRLFGLMMRGE